MQISRKRSASFSRPIKKEGLRRARNFLQKKTKQ